MTGTPTDKRFLTCESIQEVLTDYMARELGDAPSVAVREHLRTCEACRRDAAAIQKAMDLLRDAAPQSQPAATLSEDRRKRLARAVMHPVREWVYTHHRSVSLVAVLVILGLILFLVRGAILLQAPPEVDRIPIWRYFKSGDLPVLVEREYQRRKAQEPPPEDVIPPDSEK